MADEMEPIAVVGMGCRFPGDGTDPESLWDMITQGKSAWSEFPKDRMNIESYYHPSGDRQGSVSTIP
jgi:acyl transferase domain-containing protein